MACLSVNKLTLSLRGFSEAEAEQRWIAAIAAGLPGALHVKRRRSWVGTSAFELGGDDVVRENLMFKSFESHSQQTDAETNASSNRIA